MSRATIISRYSIASEIIESTSEEDGIFEDDTDYTVTNLSSAPTGGSDEDDEEEDSSSSSIVIEEDENPNVANFFKLWKDLPTLTQFGKSKKKEKQKIDIEVEMEEGSWGTLVPDFETIEKELEETDDENMGLEEEAYFAEVEVADQVEEQLEEQQVEEEEVESESSSEVSGSSEDLQLPEYDDEISPAQAAIMREATDMLAIDATRGMEMLADLDIQKDTVEHHFPTGKTEEEIKKAVVQNFLESVIKKVIDITEKVNTEAMLRINLDKRKLIRYLLSKHQDYLSEMRYTEQIQKKVVEYCRRKKLIRFLTADNTKNVEFEKTKLTNNMKRLDNLLKIRQDIGSHLQNVENQTIKEYNTIKEKAYGQVKAFETLLKDTCRAESRPRLLEAVNQLLATMNKLRQNINETCFKMLMKLDRKADLINRITELDDLGNNLNMGDFVNLQSKIINLDKKIEERGDELLKLHLRSRKNIHSMAHYKEKQKMLRDMTIYQWLAIDELIDSERALRNRIYRQKLRRNVIKRNSAEKSYQSGLLDKPIIMLDYDKTVASIKKESDTIRYLRKKQSSLQKALNEITMKYDRVKNIARNSSIVSHKLSNNLYGSSHSLYSMFSNVNVSRSSV